MKIEIDKPVIPQFVANWIESLYDEGGSEYTAIGIMLGFTSKHDKPVHDWFVYNKDTFINAVMFGYEVEEEQKYYVINKEKELILGWSQSAYMTPCIEGYEYMKHNGRENLFQLTEQEIKDYDERYWPFAVKVEESNNDL